MTASGCAAAAPAELVAALDEAGVPFVVLPIGGHTYRAAIPADLMPGGRGTGGTQMPEAIASCVLASLAQALVWDAAPVARGEAGCGSAWRAVSTLMSETDALDLAARLGWDHDPLTIVDIHAGMLAACKALGQVTPRPAVLGEAPSATVTIAGRDYVARVPEGLAGLRTSATMFGGTSPVVVDLEHLRAVGPQVDRCGPGGVPSHAGVIGLLLFDEASLGDLDMRLGDPADPCTDADVVAGVRQALEALEAPPGLIDGDGHHLEREIDNTLAELDHASRCPSPPVLLTFGGRAYPCAFPQVWNNFLVLVSMIGSAINAEGVVYASMSAEKLAMVRFAFGADAADMVLHREHARHVAALAASSPDDPDTGAAALAHAFLGVLVDLDAARTRITAAAAAAAGEAR